MRISQRLPMREITLWSADALRRRMDAAEKAAERQEGLFRDADAAKSREEAAWFRRALAKKAARHAA